VSVKSLDGFTATYVVDANMKVRKNRANASIGDVQTGDQVRVLAGKSGNTVTAQRINDSGPAQKLPPSNRGQRSRAGGGVQVVAELVDDCLGHLGEVHVSTREQAHSSGGGDQVIPGAELLEGCEGIVLTPVNGEVALPGGFLVVAVLQSEKEVSEQGHVGGGQSLRVLSEVLGWETSHLGHGGVSADQAQPEGTGVGAEVGSSQRGHREQDGWAVVDAAQAQRGGEGHQSADAVAEDGKRPGVTLLLDHIDHGGSEMSWVCQVGLVGKGTAARQSHAAQLD
jgi:hypothetical protein